VLEGHAPSLKKKGRLREGGDADIVVFDPGRIIDRATFQEPTLPSQGVRHVLINGVLVVRDGAI
jgi:N-acyl-D-glutamate deacylase